ncbi:hypothetical protein H8959_012204 [Pygathrix nigripes]
MLWARSRAWEKVPSTSVAAANKGALCELGVGTRGLATGVKSAAAPGEGRVARAPQQGQCGWCGGPARQEPTPLPGVQSGVRQRWEFAEWPRSYFSTVTPSSPGHTHGPEAAPFEDGKGGGAGGYSSESALPECLLRDIQKVDICSKCWDMGVHLQPPNAGAREDPLVLAGWCCLEPSAVWEALPWDPAAGLSSDCAAGPCPSSPACPEDTGPGVPCL